MIGQRFLMQLNILFLKNHIIDEHEMTTALFDENCHTNIRRLLDIGDIQEMMAQEKIDLFIVKGSNDELIEYAQEMLSVIGGQSFPVLYLMEETNNDIISDLKNLAAKHIIAGEQSYANLASFISLIVQKDRYKKQLRSMGSYIKETTMLFEKDSDGDFIFKQVNEAFLELEGITKYNVLEKKVKNSHLLFGVKNLLEDMQEVYDTQTPIHMPNYFYMKDSVREWCDVYIYNPTSEQVAIISSDLSEVKRAHDKSMQSNRYLQTILNAQTHIIYITDGQKLINTNQAFLDFFKCETMFDFIKKNKSVCNIFQKASEPFYIDQNEPFWHRKVAINNNEQYKVRIDHDGDIHSFIPSVDIIHVEGKEQYVVVLTDITELESEKEKLRLVAMTDTLTGTANRLKFNTMMDKFVDLSLRYDTPLSIMMFDIDNFKKINDEYSHRTGDDVLKELVANVSGYVRKADLFVRWGGEEFLLVLANTNIDNAAIAAEKFRKNIEETTFSTIGNLTCSFGITTLDKDDTISSLIARADEALYQSKSAGRNCVTAVTK